MSLRNEVERKFENFTTKVSFKGTISGFDEKLKKCLGESKQNRSFKDECEDELENINIKMNEMKLLVSQKSDASEITKVGEQLKRFAEYSDLKKLHGIVMPEISKFEKNLA